MCVHRAISEGWSSCDGRRSAREPTASPWRTDVRGHELRPLDLRWGEAHPVTFPEDLVCRHRLAVHADGVVRRIGRMDLLLEQLVDCGAFGDTSAAARREKGCWTGFLRSTTD